MLWTIRHRWANGARMMLNLYRHQGQLVIRNPTKRACEIIAELEPVPRGLYTGVIGYLGFNGESQFNIAIRTLVHDKLTECLSYHVGAGIVADSNSLAEYKETLLKGEGIRRALAQCGLDQ